MGVLALPRITDDARLFAVHTSPARVIAEHAALLCTFGRKARVALIISFAKLIIPVWACAHKRSFCSSGQSQSATALIAANGTIRKFAGTGAFPAAKAP
jgi:hypothetical protein